MTTTMSTTMTATMTATMTSAMAAAVASVATAAAVMLMLPPRPRSARSGRSVVGRTAHPGQARATSSPEHGLLRRWRMLWALSAGGGAAVVVGGPLAAPIGVAAAVGTWTAASRIEPASERRRRAEVRRDLPQVVALLAAALGSGAAPGSAIVLVCRALPGAAADRLVGIAARLQLGADPGAVWLELSADPELGPLGRTLGRAHRTGAPVAAAIEQLAEELAERARGEVEDRARAVGVRAAVPLGVCLLPSFLLLGIVPLVAGLAQQIAW